MDMVSKNPKAKDLGGNLRVAPLPLFLKKPSPNDEEITNNFDTSFDDDDLEAIPSIEHQKLIMLNAKRKVQVFEGDDSPCYYQQLHVDFKVHRARVQHYVKVIANDLSFETKLDLRMNVHQIPMVNVPQMICLQ